MKKGILILVALLLVLAVPTVALAATEEVEVLIPDETNTGWVDPAAGNAVISVVGATQEATDHYIAATETVAAENPDVAPYDEISTIKL